MSKVSLFLFLFICINLASSFSSLIYPSSYSSSSPNSSSVFSPYSSSSSSSSPSFSSNFTLFIYEHLSSLRYPRTSALQSDPREDSLLVQLRNRARKVLSGTTITVAMKHRPPYNNLVKDGRRIVEATGILMRVLNSFATTFNFTYRLKLPDDDQWGAMQEDGSWNGMVGEVHRKEIEMALGPTSITEAREKAIDFTVPFDYEPWDILIPESIVSVDLTAYLFPFSGTVWSLMLVVLLLVGILMWCLARLSNDNRLLYPYINSCQTYTVSNYLLDTYQSLMSQSVKQPHTPPVRVLSGFWLIFTVVAIASYGSKLISSLTVRIREPPVKSLEHLVESNKLQWTYLANSAMEEVFKNSDPNSLFGRVGQLHKDNPGMLVYSFEEGVAAVKSNKFAYFEDNSWLEFAVADDLALHGECRMTVVRDHFFSTRFGIILQSGSPFRDAFTLEILQMHQSGLMDAWKKEFWPKSHCIGGSSNAPQPLRALNLLDLGGTMVLWIAGASFGAISFVVEILYARCLPQD